MRKLLTLLCLAMTLSSCHPKLQWVCFYGTHIDLDAIQNVPLLVLAADTPLPVKKFTEGKKKVLGYLSLGEVDPKKSYFNEIKDKSIFIESNETWKTRIVDIRSAYWQNFILQKLIPELIERGFNGFFLDTADSVIAMEQIHPQKYKGMQVSLVKTIQEIHKLYPGFYIMVNRGIESAPAYAPFVSAILAESLMTELNPQTQHFEIRKPEQVNEYLALLKEVHEKYGIELYSLDYWSPEDRTGIDSIYEAQIKRGYIPYVATSDLDVLVRP